ncbi:MAG: hypothetical protein U0984_03265, partial [Prosthecobacter sp.]|nr:hypothetical protein [Prosthecobacter sp.]
MRSVLVISLTFATSMALHAAAPGAAPTGPTLPAGPKSSKPAPAVRPAAPADTPPVTKKPVAPPTPKPAAVKPPPEDAYRQMELLTRAMETIRQNYVDESKIT